MAGILQRTGRRASYNELAAIAPALGTDVMPVAPSTGGVAGVLSKLRTPPLGDWEEFIFTSSATRARSPRTIDDLHSTISLARVSRAATQSISRGALVDVARDVAGCFYYRVLAPSRNHAAAEVVVP